MTNIQRLEMELETAVISIEHDEENGVWECENRDKRSDGVIRAFRETYDEAREWFNKYVKAEQLASQ